MSLAAMPSRDHI